MYSCLQLSSSVASFVWKTTHFEFWSGFKPFFRNNFHDFARTQIDFSRALNHLNSYTSKISMLILLTAFHTLHIFQLSLTDFQNFPGPLAFIQYFPVLENAIIKFQDFSGFPGTVQTQLSVKQTHFQNLKEKRK